MRCSRQQGLTLIEIMVTLVLTSLGLLSVGVLQVRSLHSNQDAYLYSQASVLAYDIAERIRANPVGAVAGNYNTSLNTTVSTPATDCDSAVCATPASIANFDIHQWKEEQVKVLLPDADASVSYVAPTVTVVVQWRGFSVGNCDASGGTSGADYRCFTLSLRPQ